MMVLAPSIDSSYGLSPKHSSSMFLAWEPIGEWKGEEFGLLLKKRIGL
jgi:hypothetical protein